MGRGGENERQTSLSISMCMSMRNYGSELTVEVGALNVIVKKLYNYDDDDFDDNDIDDNTVNKRTTSTKTMTPPFAWTLVSLDSICF